MKRNKKQIGLLDCCDDNKCKSKTSLLKGDAFEVIKSIKDNSVHMSVTDPPYFIDGMADHWDVQKLERSKAKGKVVGGMPVGMKYDPRQSIELGKFIARIAPELYRVVVPGGFVLMFSQARLVHRMAVALEDAGFEIRDMGVWVRDGQAKAFGMDHFIDKSSYTEDEKSELKIELNGLKTPQLRPMHEPFIVAQKPKAGTFLQNWIQYHIGLIDTTQSIDGKFPANVVPISKPRGEEKTEHLTQKPIALIEHLIKLFSPCEGQTIFDPFMGSGSHGVAAIKANRNFIGIELDTKYYTIAQRRIQAAQNEEVKK